MNSKNWHNDVCQTQIIVFVKIMKNFVYFYEMEHSKIFPMNICLLDIFGFTVVGSVAQQECALGVH